MARVKTKEQALLDELLKDYSDPKEILGECFGKYLCIRADSPPGQ